MKVLKIIHTMGHGGAENIFRWLAWQLRQDGIDVVAGIPLDPDPGKCENWITPAVQELGIPCESFDKRGNGLDLLRNLISLIKRVKPDIVHSHLLDSNFYSSIAGRWLSVPHVCTEHGDIAFKKGLGIKAKFACTTALSNAVVCVSEAVRSSASSLTPFRGKLGLIYNGFHFSERQRSTFRSEMGIPDSSLLIGNIGNLYPVKGQRFLVDAFARFLERFPDAYLVLVGRGGEKDSLMARASRLSIPNGRVIFTGFRNDIGNILNALDLFVLSSLSEGLPVSLLEALTAEVPVIATSVGGVAEVLGDSEHGMVVPPGSADLLLESMAAVARDVNAFRKRAQRSAAMARERFSLERMSQRYGVLYERILSQKVLGASQRQFANGTDREYAQRKG